MRSSFTKYIVIQKLILETAGTEKWEEEKPISKIQIKVLLYQRTETFKRPR